MDNLIVAGNPIPYKINRETLEFIGVNREIVTLKNNLTNRALLAGKYSYDPVKDMVRIDIEGYICTIGAKCCLIKRPNSYNTKTNKSKGRRGRVLHITHLNNKANLSRIYCLVKELCLRNITMAQVDELKLNHKSNKGLVEALIDDNSPLWVNDYELVSQKENDNHGFKWNTLADWGLYTSFSARDESFIKCIDIAKTKEQFLKVLEDIDLDINEYLDK